jgi:hypothetical protein
MNIQFDASFYDIFNWIFTGLHWLFIWFTASYIIGIPVLRHFAHNYIVEYRKICKLPPGKRPECYDAVIVLTPILYVFSPVVVPLSLLWLAISYKNGE